MLTAEDLIAFEDEVADLFAQGKIKSPVHLSGGNEHQLIEIFKQIKPEDWCFSHWRSHYHALLKGVPREEVLNAILAGTSVSLCFREYNFLSSGICGGIAPIAGGVAWSLKQKDNGQIAHVFLGDMSAAMGIVYEASQYASGHVLPVRFYIEDNGKSVATDTVRAWGKTTMPRHFETYRYHLTREHCGVGKWVSMK